MKSRRGFTLIELLVVIAIIAVLAAILFPVFARVRRAAWTSNCQSNMKQVGNAVRMYCTDNDDTFPTNRLKDPSTGAALSIDPDMPLSTPKNPPIRFEAGYNWVEAIYPYIERVSGKSDASSVWKCQSISPRPLPGASYDMHEAVGYSFNIYLIEQPEGAIHGSAQMMMCREMDRLVGASLRPTNDYIVQNGFRNANLGSTADTPKTAFLADGLDDLCKTSNGGSKLNFRLHNNGSHVLFADGHVKGFKNSFMPATTTNSQSYNSQHQQWYNFAPGSTAAKQLQGSIILSP